MTLLNVENIYFAKFAKAGYASANGYVGSGAKLRMQNHRALNYELEIFDEGGQPIGILPDGFPAVQTMSHNSPLIRFFRDIGIFRDPKEFNPKELVGKEVRISVNNICDSRGGLRSVVDKFFPMEV